MSLSTESKSCAKRSKLRSTREDLYYQVTQHLKDVATTSYPLYQTDFAHGTYIISKSGRYKLMENITFHPNPQHNFRPIIGDKYYYSKHYHLGFFASIAVACDDVIIDLNHKMLQCSPEFQFSQRFYANIELTESPFIKMQGPGNFGTNIKLPKNLWVLNGKLGRSSHHGLHGNCDKNIIIENVTSQDQEFIGFAINARSNIYFKNCKAKNNTKQMPVNALWSAALFLQQWVSKLLEKYPQLQNSYDNLNNLEVNTLDLATDIVFDDNYIDQIIQHPDEDDLLTTTEESSGSSELKSTRSKPIYGCNHYMRACSIIAPCCDKIFHCRICHDEEMDSDNYSYDKQHTIDIKTVEKIVCNNCNKIQDIHQFCKDCGICFGLYYCYKCRLYDDVDKFQYPCNECGLCRIGPK